MDESQARSMIRLLKTLCTLVGILVIVAVGLATSQGAKDNSDALRLRAAETEIAKTAEWKKTKTELEIINAQAIRYLLKRDPRDQIARDFLRSLDKADPQ